MPITVNSEWNPNNPMNNEDFHKQLREILENKSVDYRTMIESIAKLCVEDSKNITINDFVSYKASMYPVVNISYTEGEIYHDGRIKESYKGYAVEFEDKERVIFPTDDGTVNCPPVVLFNDAIDSLYHFDIDYDEDIIIETSQKMFKTIVGNF